MKQRIGFLVRTIREDRGMSRQKICLDEAILSVRQLQRIENGECYPSIPTLYYLSKQLDIKISTIFDEL